MAMNRKHYTALALVLGVMASVPSESILGKAVRRVTSRATSAARNAGAHAGQIEHGAGSMSRQSIRSLAENAGERASQIGRGLEQASNASLPRSGSVVSDSMTFKLKNPSPIRAAGARRYSFRSTGADGFEIASSKLPMPSSRAGSMSRKSRSISSRSSGSLSGSNSSLKNLEKSVLGDMNGGVPNWVSQQETQAMARMQKGGIYRSNSINSSTSSLNISPNMRSPSFSTHARSTMGTGSGARQIVKSPVQSANAWQWVKKNKLKTGLGIGGLTGAAYVVAQSDDPGDPGDPGDSDT